MTNHDPATESNKPVYYVPPPGADGYHVARALDQRLHTYDRVATTKTKAEAERMVAALNAEAERIFA